MAEQKELTHADFAEDVIETVLASAPCGPDMRRRKRLMHVLDFSNESTSSFYRVSVRDAHGSFSAEDFGTFSAALRGYNAT